ncbi:MULTISPECIES: hypothetical protein [Ensifer]|jgi:hypothetical protein|uniref:Uncharacterized protein n=1 Tax=Ensifer canadensis TaxID=555315 RepID=A0AAW4FIF3_9HYPH|nr:MULTISPECIES: hypothetical protein [Ensifer]MBM3091890.1 hypothetical protein [Ensifer canadensis]NOV18582.1 hypothetical protein [Ensifer canadensis]UBI77981.1 hypothetical protein J3R84_25970 [Ensifer canadensis]
MKRLFPMALLPILLGGCATTMPAEVTSLADPSQSSTGAGGQAYRSPVAGYVHREPVGPKRWVPLNDAQSPAKGGAS